MEEQEEEASPRNNDEHSGSQYSLSFGYGDETTDGMELRDAEIVLDDEYKAKRDMTPDNLSQESYEEVKTSTIDNNDDE